MQKLIGKRKLECGCPASNEKIAAKTQPIAMRVSWSLRHPSGGRVAFSTSTQPEYPWQPFKNQF